MEINKDQTIAMLVLSCDNYSDLWDDFFNLREKFWPDCPYKWYVVTESHDYFRKGVEVIKCGKEMNWAGRYRYAVNFVKTAYVYTYLEDYFISSKVNNDRFNSILKFVIDNNVDFLDLGNIFRFKIDNPTREYYAEHMVIIPKHMKNGLDTAPAIWKTTYLLEKLGNDDYSAWEFEKRLCDEAASEDGFNGIILADDQLSSNISTVPVVVQGLFYPPSIKYFKKRGYEIDISKRRVMNIKEQMFFDTKMMAAKMPFGRNLLKWFGRKFLGLKFVS